MIEPDVVLIKKSDCVLLAGGYWLAGEHEGASLCGSQFPGDPATSLGHKIFDTNGCIPYTTGPVPGGGGNSRTVRRPRYVFYDLSVSSCYDDLNAEFYFPDADGAVP